MFMSFAPMEGVTGAAYRRIHRQMFPGADRYYAPFVSPDTAGTVKRSQLEALRRDEDPEFPLVPQILANNAASFLAAARRLADLGYGEINLNLGCPSGTVAAKHKGAGLLADADALRRLLDGIFAQPPAAVSVKTRMGWASTAEFPALLEIFRAYPLAELIVHARDRAGMYRSDPDVGGFASVPALCPFPVCYNGNVFSPADLARLRSALPGLERVMIGRGAAADPARFRLLRGADPLGAGELRAFLDALLDEALSSGLSPVYALSRMKELWYYLRWKFPGCDKELKAVFKSRRIENYRAALDALFDGGGFDPYSFYGSRDGYTKEMPLSF